MALLLLPQAGYTVSYFFRDSSKYTVTPSFTANGHTPPTAWPMRVMASSGVSILALEPKYFTYQYDEKYINTHYPQIKEYTIKKVKVTLEEIKDE